VLSRYPSLKSCVWEPLTQHGGLSGARLWLGHADGEPAFVSKRYPASVTGVSLGEVQVQMLAAKQAAGEIVPTVMPNADGQLWTAHSGRVWDVQTYRPGTPSRGSAAQVEAGLDLIRRLHATWAHHGTVMRQPPGVAARLRVLRSWKPANRPNAVSELLRQHQAEFVEQLQVQQGVPCNCHWIHGDLHAQHLLFTKEGLTGVIDFAAGRVDLPAFDAIRWLTDVCPMSLHLWRDQSLDFRQLRLLAGAGVLASLVRWCDAGVDETHPRVSQLLRSFQILQSC